MRIPSDFVRTAVRTYLEWYDAARVARINRNIDAVCREIVQARTRAPLDMARRFDELSKGKGSRIVFVDLCGAMCLAPVGKRLFVPDVDADDSAELDWAVAAWWHCPFTRGICVSVDGLEDIILNTFRGLELLGVPMALALTGVEKRLILAWTGNINQRLQHVTPAVVIGYNFHRFFKYPPHPEAVTVVSDVDGRYPLKRWQSKWRAYCEQVLKKC